MNTDEIADELVGSATTLRDEVADLSQLFGETGFLGDCRNFPHAHFGYIMACMSQIDLLSKCAYGEGEPKGGQTVRMRDFMMRYIDDQKSAEHRVAIKLFRHTLMHTGALRPIWEDDGTAYTWRVYFTDTMPQHCGHYTLTDEAMAFQHDFVHKILDLGTAIPTRIKSLNLLLPDFSRDILRAAINYTTEMRQDPTLASKLEGVYPKLCAQQLL
ncbi:hypothetical protein B1R94_07820 [Mycolicibacterium litorale]|nr:hypothetical protein B1R94_07820 [Mycolicibacterium litorale]